MADIAVNPAPAGEREYARVSRVWNSPGPGRLIRYDIVLTRIGGASPGSYVYTNVKSVGQVPGDNGTEEYDIIGGRAGTPATVDRSDGTLRFMVPWQPKTARCPGALRNGNNGTPLDRLPPPRQDPLGLNTYGGSPTASGPTGGAGAGVGGAG